MEQLEDFVLRTIQNADYRDICLRTTVAELSKNEAKPYLERVVCQKIGKTIYLKKQARGGVRAQIKGDSIISKDIFYIDNVTSTRLQHGTSSNILTVRQLNESFVRGFSRAWQLKKLIEKGKLP